MSNALMQKCNFNQKKIFRNNLPRQIFKNKNINNIIKFVS